MKKTLIALTLAALPVASMAEVVLYGQIKGGVEVSKEKNTKGTVTNIVDYGSRIGFKGQEQLSEGLKAIWKLEQGVDIAGGRTAKDVVVGMKKNPTTGEFEPIMGKVNESKGFGTRDSFIGLEGAFGQVKAGYFHNPVTEVNGKLDQWEYDSGAAGLGMFTRTNDVTKRRVAVGYTTPDMGGFTAKAYVSPSDNNRMGGSDANRDDGDKGNKRIDRPVYGVGASFQQPGGGFFADVAATAVKRGANNAEYAVRTAKGEKVSAKHKYGYQAVAQAGFSNDTVTAGLAYQHAQNVDAGLVRFQEVAASAAYTINDAVTLKGSAAYGFNAKGYNDELKIVKDDNAKYIQGVIGADYHLSKRTELNSQIGYVQFGKEKESRTGVGTVGVGLKHRF